MAFGHCLNKPVFPWSDFQSWPALWAYRGVITLNRILLDSDESKFVSLHLVMLLPNRRDQEKRRLPLGMKVKYRMSPKEMVLTLERRHIALICKVSPPPLPNPPSKSCLMAWEHVLLDLTFPTWLTHPGLAPQPHPRVLPRVAHSVSQPQHTCKGLWGLRHVTHEITGSSPQLAELSHWGNEGMQWSRPQGGISHTPSFQTSLHPCYWVHR